MAFKVRSDESGCRALSVLPGGQAGLALEEVLAALRDELSQRGQERARERLPQLM